MEKSPLVESFYERKKVLFIHAKESRSSISSTQEINLYSIFSIIEQDHSHGSLISIFPSSSMKNKISSWPHILKENTQSRTLVTYIPPYVPI